MRLAVINFSGNVGKTTIARILARCLNCETGITSNPCGECSACREINEGRFIDLPASPLFFVDEYEAVSPAGHART